MVDAGNLDKRVTIQKVTETRDTEGGIKQVWSTYITRWAGIRPLRGNDRFLAQQEYRELTHEIRLHYDSKTKLITNKHRVSFSGRVFDIQSIINPRERNQDIVLRTIEKSE